MPATMQNIKISCRGGLDLNSTNQELLSRPGYATILSNFECVSSGGYRRINGYAPYGTTAVPGAGAIKGIHILPSSIIVARGNELYHTFDTITWVQINKEVVDADYATIEAASGVSMDNSASRVRFDNWSNGTSVEDQHVVAVNGYDYAMYFKVRGTAHTNATYTFTYLDDVTTGAPQGCTYVTAFEDQFFITGRADTPSTVYVSTIFDPLTWNGTASLQISTGDPVTGLFPFREKMIVFCRDSIFSLDGVNEQSPVLLPITKKIGCISGDTIQEVGGDLIYLAPDGLRTLAGTDRIGDVEISTVSSQIQRLMNEITSAPSTFEFHSTVIRKSSQYRLYYPKAGASSVVAAKGIIGTLVRNPEGGLNWNWSTTARVSPKHVTEALFNGEYLSLMSTKDDGLLYQHDTGITFDGDPIISTFTTPYFDVGDPSIRKNFHSIRTYLLTEGDATIRFNVKYSEKGNELAHQPAFYTIGDFAGNSTYGSAIYNSNNVYDAPIINSRVSYIEGSGFTASFTYFTGEVTDAPFNIQGFDINFIASGKV